MTSMPASRSARAMIFAPRSCPSSPGLATTTRILRVDCGGHARDPSPRYFDGGATVGTAWAGRPNARGAARSSRCPRRRRRALGTSLSAPLVDLPRRVVWQPDAGSIRLVDLGAGAGAGARAAGRCRRAAPARCAATGCCWLRRRQQAARPARPARPGRCRRGGRPRRRPASACPRPGGSGREGACSPPAATTVFWRSTARRSTRRRRRANQLPDLDSPQRRRPVCAPLARTLAVADEDQRRSSPTYSRPAGATSARTTTGRCASTAAAASGRAAQPLPRAAPPCTRRRLGRLARARPHRLYRGTSRRTVALAPAASAASPEPFPTRGHASWPPALRRVLRLERAGAHLTTSFIFWSRRRARRR